MKILLLLISIMFSGMPLLAESESTMIPGQAGRVLFLPGGSVGFFFTGNDESHTTLMIDSDLEYQAGLVTLFGNVGLGFNYDRFTMQFQGGFKYKLPYITRNLKPFLKTGLSFSPIVDDYHVTLFTGFLGGGMQYYLNHYNGIECSIDLHGGRFIGESLGAFYSRIRLSWIMVF